MGFKISVLLLFVLGAITLNKNREYDKLFCIVACVMAILLSGLRHIHVGVDTYNYWKMFERCADASWTGILEGFLPSNFFSIRTENGILFVMKIFQLFSNSFRLFLIMFAIFVNVPIFMLIYKESKHIFVSTLIYMSVYWFFLSTTGLRQTISIVIMCFFGLNSIRERDIRKFILFVFVAFLFHKSSLIFIPFYYLSNKKVTSLSIIVSVALIITVFVFRSYIGTSLFSFQGWYEAYTDQYETAGPITFTFLSVAILILTFLYHKNIESNCINALFLENSAIFACVMLPFAFVDPTMLRAVFYFSIFSIWLVPEIIDANRVQDKQFMLTMVVTALFILLLTSTPPYKFMWETGIYSNIISPV